jgi:hypothetical protein
MNGCSDELFLGDETKHAKVCVVSFILFSIPKVVSCHVHVPPLFV